MPTESELKDIWLSYYNYETFEKSRCVNEVFLPPIVLLESAIFQCKKLASRYIECVEVADSYRKELELKSTELKELRNKLDETSEPCRSCDSLGKQLTSANKRAKEAEKRVNQIAEILNLKNVESQSTAFALVSQMLTESPNRKKRKVLLDKDNVRSPVKLSNDSLSPDCLKLNKTALMIPETEFIETPKRSIQQDDKNNSIDLSEVITKKPTTPRKNRSANLPLLIEESPKKIHFDIGLMKHDEDASSSSLSINEKPHLPPSPLNGSLLDYVQSSHNELDRIWFGDDSGKQADSLAKKNKTTPSPNKLNKSPKKKKNWSPHKKKDVWLMKKKPGSSSVDSRGKKMKQTTLSVAQPVKMIDISSREVNVNHDNEGSSDDEIILPSPKKDSHAVQTSDTCDLTFDPSKCPTSTQKQKKLDSSYDVIEVDKSHQTPNYQYKGKTVRGKEREKLPGWDCQECREYYELAGRNAGSSKLKASIDKCSRHRSKHNPYETHTPPGYWDVDMPSSEEARKMYTSIHVKRPT